MVPAGIRTAYLTWRDPFGARRTLPALRCNHLPAPEKGAVTYSALPLVAVAITARRTITVIGRREKFRSSTVPRTTWPAEPCTRIEP